MSQQSTPFDNGAVWSLAGSSSDGIIYAVSIDPILLDVNLWAYISVQGRWKILARSDHISVSENDGHHCLMSTIYNQDLARVDVFLEIHDTTAFLFRFLTAPTARLECVIGASNTDNIRFNGVNGPSLHYCGNELIICGGRRDDHFMHIYRIDLNTDGRQLPDSFALSDVWTGGFPHYTDVVRFVAVGGKFLAIAGWTIMIFTPIESQPWTDLVFQEIPWRISEQEREMAFSSPHLCPSESFDRFWYVPHFDPAKEAILSNDDGLIERCSIEFGDDDDGPSDCQGPHQVVAVSSSHLFWVEDVEEGPEVVKSKLFSPSSLQYACLSKLCSSIPDFKECDTEEKAANMGIPVLTWRRYCK